MLRKAFALSRLYPFSPSHLPTSSLHIIVIPTALSSNVPYLYSTSCQLPSSLHPIDPQQQEDDLGYDQSNTQSQHINSATAIIQYPFIQISASQLLTQWPQNDARRRDLIALKILEGTQQLSYKLILSLEQQADLRVNPSNSNYSRQEAFDLYFQPQINSLIKMINNRAEVEKNRLEALAILSQTSPVCLAKHQLAGKIDREAVMGNAQLVVRYAFLLLKADIALPKNIESYLQNQLNGESSVEARKHLARVVLTSLSLSRNKFSFSIVISALSLLTAEIKSSSLFEIGVTIKHLYSFPSAASQLYLAAVFATLKSRQKDNHSDMRYFLKVLSQLVKCLHRHNLQTREAILYAVQELDLSRIRYKGGEVGRYELYRIVFEGRGHKQYSLDVIAHLKAFLLQALEQLSSLGENKSSRQLQVERRHIVVSRLLRQYFNRLSVHEQEKVRKLYIRKILSNEQQQVLVVAYALEVVLKEKRAPPRIAADEKKYEQDGQIIKRSLAKCLKEYSVIQDGKLVMSIHINMVIQFMYQIHRHQLQLPIQQLPSVYDYDFSCHPLDYQYIDSLLGYIQLSDPPLALLQRVWMQLKEQLMAHLSRQKVRMDQLMKILLVCSRVGMEDKGFYEKVESMLMRAVKQKGYKLRARQKEVIREVVVERGFGSCRLRDLVERREQG